MMAEDDDDDTFGDFTFSNSNFNSNSQSNGHDDEDDWGDFVKSPQQQSKPSITANNSWVKPSGALPLSIFGFDDDDDHHHDPGLDVKSNNTRKDDGAVAAAAAADFKFNPLTISFTSTSNGTSGIANSITSADLSKSSSYSRITVANLYDHSQLAGKSGGNREFSFAKFNVLERSANVDPFSGWSLESNGSTSNLNPTTSNMLVPGSDLDLNGKKQQVVGVASAIHDDDDDGWEFKDANAEFHNAEVVDPGAHESIERSTQSSGAVSSSNKSLDLFGTSNGSVDLFENSTESVDYFVGSNGISRTSKELDWIGSQPSTANLNGFITDSSSNIKQNNRNSTLSSILDVGGTEFDEDFGDFAAASMETGPNTVINHDVDPTAHEVSERSAQSFEAVSSSEKSIDLFGTSNGSVDLFAMSNESVDYFAGSTGTSGEVDLIGSQPSTATLNGLVMDTNSNIIHNNWNGTLNRSLDVGETESDEDFGDFTAASAETGPNAVVSNNVNPLAPEVSESSVQSFGAVSSSNKSIDDLFATSNGSVDLFATSTESSDYFAGSSGISRTSGEMNLVNSQSSTATLNDLIMDTSSNIKQNNGNGTLNPSVDVGGTEFDEDFGDFTAASAETGASTVEQDTKLNYHKGALPLSIFGYEEQESGDSSEVQDAFMHQSSFDQRNSPAQSKVISVSDLISSLYSQTKPAGSVEKPNKPQLNLSSAVSISNLVNDADLHDDNSWHLNGASQTRIDEDTSLYNSEVTYWNINSKLKLNNYLDFYSRLKEELCSIAKGHAESLKLVRDDDALSGEEASGESLVSEFQLVCKEMNFPLEHSNRLDHLSSNSYFKELIEVLQQPHFQILESEYHLSEKLLEAEKDLKSAIELIRHTTTMLKILTTGSLEERSTYMEIWTEIVSVCFQELKHGATIWNKAVEKHVQSRLLSKPQGRKFILALGEMYRVIVVLGASVKLFKPWILSGSLVKSSAIYNLLDECHAVWSTSGLEEALSSVGSAETVPLFKSIKHITGLDALALQSYVFTEKGFLCRLSMLSDMVAPGMKMIMWGQEQYFVTLANVWANLISSDAPKLPHLNFG